MNGLQKMIIALLPQRWAAAIEAESRTWVMQCPCGHITSVWEMGGIRYKAAGNPWRIGRCAQCGKTFRGQLYQR
ncbi:MAG: hypothetical protein KF832_25695 [Caldilineaceae bacterium]|nr:hypothetical protein [Caldilineaceae bacterium]